MSDAACKGLWGKVRNGHPVIVAGVGSGLTARGAVEGGADLLAVYSTAVYRIRNLPSALAFVPGDDPNALTFKTAPEVIANAGGRSVLLGIGAHDPRLDLDVVAGRVAAEGGAGLTNEPFVGLYGPAIRSALEEAGCGFSREIALIGAAKRRGLLTLGWACDAEEARRMADAGADLIGLMLGITGEAQPLEPALLQLQAMAEAARQVNSDALLLAHGGPLDRPERVATVLTRGGVNGYVTGSSAERTPVIASVADAVAAFSALRFAPDKRLEARHLAGFPE